MKIKTFPGIFYLLIFCFGIEQASAQIPEINDQDLPVKCLTYPNKKYIEKIRDRLLYDSSLYFVNYQAIYDCPLGRFRIHYDTTGVNAVSRDDLNQNRIPDWVDTVCSCFNRAWEFESDTLGYAPPSDGGDGGSDAYDITIQDLGNSETSTGIYGITTPLHEILPKKKYDRYATFISVDNNYSKKDSSRNVKGIKVASYPMTNGSDALKVTSAHEFHHSIQYGYGDPLPASPELNELTSTWMEWKMYPEIKDYFQYLPILFKNLEEYNLGNTGNTILGYSWAIFDQYIDRTYGDKIILRQWQLIGDGIEGITALDSALREKGSSLPQAFTDFLPWMYYTGARAIEGDYFDDASRFPMIIFDANHYPTRGFDTHIPHFSLQDNGGLKSFEIKPLQFVLPNIQGDSGKINFDILIANTDMEAAARQSFEEKPYVVMASRDNSTEALKVKCSDCYFSYAMPEGDISVFTVSPCPEIISMAYPNPFRPSIHSKICFPVPDNALIDKPVLLTVYNAAMDMVYEFRKDVQRVEFADSQLRRAITLSADDEIKDMSSGVYIYYIKLNEVEITGKFAILR